MIENRIFTIKTVALDEDKRHGKFECEPLNRGYGITLGNSLRRVLLSSLNGVAITSIKIDGVLHEFSTIDGIREDVTDIILNLKKIRFIAHDEAEFPIKVRVDITKEGIFHAGDLQLPAEIDVLNKDLALCTLDKDAHLGMEMTIDEGHGYVPFTKNKKEDDPIGVIPIDSIYSPVIKCNYEVSDTRVGNEMDFDKLTLEVLTDGSITAPDAVATAATILINCFTNFQSLATKPIDVEPADAAGTAAGEAEEEKKENQIDISTIPIEDLELSVRAFNCLKRAEIDTLKELTEKSEEELTRVRNLGKKSVDGIKSKLAAYKGLGLHLRNPKD
jgi:DNA-directed RNA polymerase subunit alpha